MRRFSGLPRQVVGWKRRGKGSRRRSFASGWMLLAVLLLNACADETERTADVLPVTTQAVEEPAAATETATPSQAPSPFPPTAPATSAVSTSEPAATDVPTSVPTEPPKSLSFAVIGDYGTTWGGAQDVAEMVNVWDPDLVITVGDNNYPDGAAGTIAAHITHYFGRFIDEGRFFPTLGNHDMTTDEGRPYLDYFELPGNERYYDFVRGDVHFFALNSDWREVDGIGANSRQAEWLYRAMTASTAAWQVVYFHAPPYVSMEAKRVQAMAWPFAHWGADLVLSGHAHLYERLQVEGIPFVVNGLGGGGIYDFDEQPYAGSQVRYNADYGALLVEATGSGLTLQFVSRAGTVVDRMTLGAAD